jgi:hypothetical protein
VIKKKIDSAELGTAQRQVKYLEQYVAVCM